MLFRISTWMPFTPGKLWFLNLLIYNNIFCLDGAGQTLSLVKISGLDNSSGRSSQLRGFSKYLVYLSIIFCWSVTRVLSSSLRNSSRFLNPLLAVWLRYSCRVLFTLKFCFASSNRICAYFHLASQNILCFLLISFINPFFVFICRINSCQFLSPVKSFLAYLVKSWLLRFLNFTKLYFILYSVI